MVQIGDGSVGVDARRHRNARRDDNQAQKVASCVKVTRMKAVEIGRGSSLCSDERLGQELGSQGS